MPTGLPGKKKKGAGVFVSPFWAFLGHRWLKFGYGTHPGLAEKGQMGAKLGPKFGQKYLQTISDAKAKNTLAH